MTTHAPADHRPARPDRPRPLTDSTTMLRRRMVHMRRYPSLTIMLVGQPIVLLLLFVHVFGATMGAGLAGPGAGRTEYLAYITPAILLMTVASIAMATAIGIATDMTEGVVARFRTMAIAGSACSPVTSSPRSSRRCSRWRWSWPWPWRSGSAARPGRAPGSAWPGCSAC